MTTTTFIRYTGWSAYASAIATIVTFVTAVLFFAVGQPFGTINDIASMFQVLFMLPLAFMSYLLFRADGRSLSMVASLSGIAGIVTVAIGQSLLIIGAITYQQSLTFIPAGAAIGVWLLLTDYQALSSKRFPRRLAWVGVLAGVAYILTVVGFLLGGQDNPLFYAGGLMLVISYSIWAIWLGRRLLSGKDIGSQG